MRLSHSALSTLISCPMSYKLSYIEHIQPIVEKSAFAIGSAVHWGLEHNTSNLDEYYGVSYKATQGYTQEQFLAETMLEAYFRKKELFMKEILRDEETGEQLELLREDHEVWVTGLLPSYKYEEKHKFVGCIDLRLLTNKGYIIMDYKTSTQEPHWDDYLDQIYRYIFMSETSEPDIPVIKCGIINLRKKQLRVKKDETEDQFRARFKFEYDADDDNLIVLHMFPRQRIDKKLLDLYVDNLSRMADTGQLIIEKGAFFINYPAANGQYGHSPYWDIFYHTPECWHSYTIADFHFDNTTLRFEERRVCKEIDMKVIDNLDVLNHYYKFHDFVNRTKVIFNLLENNDEISEDMTKIVYEARLMFDEVDEDLLKNYVMTYLLLKSLPRILDIDDSLQIEQNV